MPRRFALMLGAALVFGLLLILSACDDGPATAVEPPVRGLVTTVVSAASDRIQRRYPGVLEPASITSLSFEVGGRLGEVTLEVGQRVATGEPLARLEDEKFAAEIGNREAAVREAEATFNQAQADLARLETLLQRGVVTRVARDNARTDFRRARAQLDQAQKALETARDDLNDAVLVAPFDGIINTVEVDSFQTVAGGATVASLYSAEAYEVSFSVSFDVISKLVVGTPATIRLADDPAVALEAVVSELGERADAVSSFPVVVRLREGAPVIRAGMAVEVALAFPVDADRGFLIPLSAAITEGELPADARAGQPLDFEVFVYDEATETVKRRAVVMGGMRGNQFVVVEGLEAGEHVAIAGVSFLREGMRVRLLPPREETAWTR